MTRHINNAQCSYILHRAITMTMIIAATLDSIYRKDRHSKSLRERDSYGSEVRNRIEERFGIGISKAMPTY